MKPEDFNITKYKFRPDGTLDVFEDVGLNNYNLIELPLKFGKIYGDFSCSFNLLKNLKNSPKIIMGDFWCNWTKLKNINDLNLDGISGEIHLKNNPDLKLTEKEQLWAILNPGRLIL